MQLTDIAFSHFITASRRLNLLGNPLSVSENLQPNSVVYRPEYKIYSLKNVERKTAELKRFQLIIVTLIAF